MRTAKSACYIAAAMVLSASSATACGGSIGATSSINSEEVSQSTFKGTWPVIPSAGVLACELGAVSFTPTDSKDTYAVNAIATNRAKEKGWRTDFEHIWLTEGGGQNDTPGVQRVSVGDFITQGLNLCGPPWGSSATASPAAPSAGSKPQAMQVELPLTGLKDASGVAVDTAGNVYITDAVDNRALELQAGSSTQIELPFTGLKETGAIAVDSAGNVYVADNNRVLKLPAGSSTQVELPFTGLKEPGGVAADSAGNVYVTDGGDVTPAHLRVLKLPAGSSDQVQLPFTGLTSPGGVAVDTAGNVYVTNDADPPNGGANQVLKLPAGSNTQVELPFTGLTFPMAVAVDAAGNVYATDVPDNAAAKRRVLKLPAGSNTQVELPFMGLHFPDGVAADNAGNVYVTNRIQVLKLPAG
jgi:DNA-binding beta-propeller fold protein YncE